MSEALEKYDMNEHMKTFWRLETFVKLQGKMYRIEYKSFEKFVIYSFYDILELKRLN